MRRREKDPELHPVTGLPRTRPTPDMRHKFSPQAVFSLQVEETAETNELLVALLAGQRETNRLLTVIAAGVAKGPSTGAS